MISLPRFALLLLALFQKPAFSIKEVSGESQKEYERSIEAILRNKQFYKAGRIEVGLDVGTMPYDSVVNHYMGGGRLSWHFADHYGWEILDLQAAFPQVTGYARDLARDKGISNLQTVEIRNIVGSSFLVSPFYGKIRMLGTLHFDIYLVGGLGLANTQTLKLVSPGTAQEAQTFVVNSGWDPVMNLGFGFKIFMNNAMGLIVDLRDYLIYSQVYAGKRIMSNFSVFGGISFFLPTFG